MLVKIMKFVSLCWKRMTAGICLVEKPGQALLQDKDTLLLELMKVEMSYGEKTMVSSIITIMVFYFTPQG